MSPEIVPSGNTELLRQMQFPNCGLRHEQIRHDLRESSVLLPILATDIHEPFCKFNDRGLRPACPHYVDRPSSDPLMQAVALLNRNGYHFHGRAAEYREWRNLLWFIDHAIREVRKSLHRKSTNDLHIPESEACAGALRYAERLVMMKIPEQWQSIADLTQLEEAMLAEHENIRQGMQKLRDDVLTSTLELAAKQ